MKNLPIIFLIVLTSSVVKAQDPFFTQYLSTPLYFNPAFAGYEGCSRISSTYRNEWPAQNRQFVTYNVSYDQHINKIGGIGVNFQQDNAGQERLGTTLASLSFAPTFKLHDQKIIISPAIDLGWRRRSFDSGFNNHFDLNAGILVTHGQFVYGAAFHHITQPDEGLGGKSILPVKYTGHLTYVYELNDDFKVSPTVILQGQPDFRLFILGIAGDYKNYRAGLAYRNRDTFIVQAGFTRKWLTVGYSYDFNASKLNIQNTNGNHEVHLSARFNYKDVDNKRKGVGLIGF